MMTLLINQVLFSFDMRIYASFAEMNMILMTIAKARLLSLDSWNMRYPSSKFCKNFTLSKALFFIINRFCLPCVTFYFLWLFNPYDCRDNTQWYSCNHCWWLTLLEEIFVVARKIGAIRKIKFNNTTQNRV